MILMSGLYEKLAAADYEEQRRDLGVSKNSIRKEVEGHPRSSAQMKC
jgi:hypothetical protein